jgi:putative endonuclease
MLAAVASQDPADWKRKLKKLGLGRVRAKAAPAQRAPRPKNLVSGGAGEAAAADFLARRGVQILERNVRYVNGEIDLVAEAGGIVLFVEVKRRRDAERGTSAEAVTPRKRARVVRAARRWLLENPARAVRDVRFDVVAIQDEPAGIDWIQGAFDAS